MAALSLGCWAEDASQATSLAGWLRAHPPSEAIWIKSLEPLGYRTPKDPLLLQRVARTIPSELNAENAVWATRDAQWIALFKDASIRFFCADCAREARDWESLGDGWSGFEPALKRGEKRAQVPVLTARKQPAARDPLEIVF